MIRVPVLAFTALAFLVVSLPLGSSAEISDASSSQADRDVPDGWLSEIEEQIATSEYRVTWQSTTRLTDLDAAWHAANRTHDFRTYFTREGIRVIPRTEDSPSWEWNLALIGVGRGQRVWPVKEAADLIPDESRIEYSRGDILEWYVNSRRAGRGRFPRPRAERRAFADRQRRRPDDRFPHSTRYRRDPLCGTACPGRTRERASHMDGGFRRGAHARYPHCHR